MDKYTFGKNLYELRNKKGLTQKELGKLLGVSDKAVSKWETGEAMPRTAKLVLITDLFGVTMEQLSSEDFDCNAEDFQQNETAEQKESRYKKYFDKAMKQYYLLSKFWSVLATGLFVVTVISLVASVLTSGSVGFAAPLWKMVLVYLLPFFILIYAKELYSKLYKNREKTEISDFVPLTLALIVFSVVFCITGFIDVTKEDVVNFIGCFVTCLSLGVLLCFLKSKNKGRLSEKKVAAIFAIALISVGISVGANLSNDVTFFMLLAEFALISSISDLLIVAVITSVLDNDDYEKNNKGKNKFIKKALVSSVIAFVVISMAFTLFPGLAYKMYCQNMQKGQEINIQWETQDVFFEKGESKRISMDWFSVEIPKELKKSDFESSLENTTMEMYKNENVATVSIQKLTDNPYADFDLFEITDEASEEDNAVNEMYLLNFQKEFGKIPSSMYEYHRLAASLDADDMKVYDFPQCVLYTQLIATAQMLSFGGSNEVYYVDTDRTYGEITVIPPLLENDDRLIATYSVVDKYNLDEDYRVIISIPNNDRDLLHKIINSVEIDL